MICLLTYIVFCSNLVLVRPVVIVTATIIILYMSGLFKRMIKQWGTRGFVQPISFEPRHSKNQSQKSTETMSTKKSQQGDIPINNQSHNPEVTKTWHNYMVSTIWPLTLIIPKLYEETDLNFFAETLEFRIHIIFLGFIYLLSIYVNNHKLRNFVKSYYIGLLLNITNVA